MGMQNEVRDYWTEHFYRQLAKVIHDPSAENERHLADLVAAYRRQCDVATWESRELRDPHEWIMDFV